MLRCSMPLRQTLNKNKNKLFTIHKSFQSTVREQSVVAEDQKFHNNSIFKRGRPKIPSKDPLVKNFLVGVVDKNLLAFPEVIPRDDYAKLKENTWTIENYFKESFDPNIPISQCLDDLKNLGLFGLNIPQLQGGNGYFFSESLLVAEHENISTSLGAFFSSHRSVVDVISQCGTDLQKEKYLSKLANGSIVATEAIHEKEPTNDDLFNTKAIYDVDQDIWILNGEKSFVPNGPSSDLYLVMAQSNPMTLEHEQQITCSIFLIDSNTPGVSRGVTHTGHSGIENCSLSFKNVRLDESNVVGGKMQNHKVGQVYMKSSRLRNSLVNLELSKKIANHLTNYCINTKQCGSFLK